MENIQIKILKDTPFDKKDTLLSIDAFRLKYSYYCSKNVTDKELQEYLLTSKSEWFMVNDTHLSFIVDNILYRKELDGLYHKFLVGTPLIKENCIGTCHVPEALETYKTKQFCTLIPYYTNDLHKKP